MNCYFCEKPAHKFQVCPVVLAIILIGLGIVMIFQTSIASLEKRPAAEAQILILNISVMPVDERSAEEEGEEFIPDETGILNARSKGKIQPRY